MSEEESDSIEYFCEKIECVTDSGIVYVLMNNRRVFGVLPINGEMEDVKDIVYGSYQLDTGFTEEIIPGNNLVIGFTNGMSKYHKEPLKSHDRKISSLTIKSVSDCCIADGFLQPDDFSLDTAINTFPIYQDEEKDFTPNLDPGDAYNTF